MSGGHEKLEAAGVKHGDQVRITIEGLLQLEGRTGISLYDKDRKIIFACLTGLEMDRLVLIERIEQPLKVGDRVRFASNEMSTTGVIVAMDPHPVIRFEPPSGGCYYDSVVASALVRA